MHSWNTFDAWTNHEQTRTHKTHHSLDLGEATTFPLIVYSIHGQHPNGTLSKDSQVGVPKFSKLGLSQFWRPITLCTDLKLRWGLKQSCSPCWDLFNGIYYATWTQGNQGNSWLLVVGSQIGNLILGPSFGHNLCFKYQNGWYEPI